MIHILKYGNTNTYFIDNGDGLLIDTDFAGTMPAFFRAIKRHGLQLRDIHYVIATHYHPDHCGLISELTQSGVKLVLLQNQVAHTHFADKIFARVRGLNVEPIQNDRARILSFQESRGFLRSIGIAGEIFQTKSHSDDGIAVALDSGECFVGDVEPFSYLEGYDENPKLKQDWDRILSFHPKVVYHAHANKKYWQDFLSAKM